MARMVAPKMAVVLDDDTEYTIQTDNRDLVRFDLIRGRHKWPTLQDAPKLWATVIAWSCLAREGKLPGQNVEAELDRILAVDLLDEDGNPVDINSPAAAEAVAVDPS